MMLELENFRCLEKIIVILINAFISIVHLLIQIALNLFAKNKS